MGSVCGESVVGWVVRGQLVLVGEGKPDDLSGVGMVEIARNRGGGEEGLVVGEFSVVIFEVA